MSERDEKPDFIDLAEFDPAKIFAEIQSRSPEQLKLCEEVLKSIEARKGEDVNEWARRLAEDMAQFDD